MGTTRLMAAAIAPISARALDREVGHGKLRNVRLEETNPITRLDTRVDRHTGGMIDVVPQLLVTDRSTLEDDGWPAAKVARCAFEVWQMKNGGDDGATNASRDVETCACER